MGEPLEIELKLEIDPEDAATFAPAALAGAGDAVVRQLVSTYYDTPDLDLQAAGFSLRIRAIDGQHVQTVKASGAVAAAGLFVRPEWERPVEGGAPVLDAGSGPLAQMVDPTILARVAPLFASEVERSIWTVEREGARIEVALDRGQVRAGDAAAPLCEIELELEEGEPRALFDLARAIDETVPVRIGILSKSERGHDLLAGRAPRSVKAEPVAIAPDADVCEAFAAIAHACLRQFRLNETLVLQTGGVAPLHQARVGLRRLRSAFSLFRPLLADDPRADQLRGELRWLAAELGEVRNLDVLISRSEGDLQARLAAARERTFAHVRDELVSARTRRMMIDLVEWLAIGAWRTDPADAGLAGTDARDFAADSLDIHRKRLKRKGRRLAKLDDEHRHEARIEAKKLRYATEFFAPLFTTAKKPRRRHAAFLGALEAMQEVLGDLNDLATGPQVLEQLGIALPLPPVTGKSRDALLAEAGEAYEAWADAKRFWR